MRWDWCCSYGTGAALRPRVAAATNEAFPATVLGVILGVSGVDARAAQGLLAYY